MKIEYLRRHQGWKKLRLCERCIELRPDSKFHEQ